MKDKKVAVILFIMCFLLTIGICIQIKTIDKAKIGSGSTMQQTELRDEVLKEQEKYDRAVKELAKKEEKLEKLISNISDENDNTALYSERLANLNNLLGYTALKGKGIIITIDDADVSSSALNVSDYLVHDGDLLQIVNALTNAGAEAIDINGQRIVSSTAITCAGNIIKINNEKVGTPFVISAIGLTEQLYGAITMPGGYVSLLQDTYGLKIEIEKSNSVRVEKYNGVYKLDFGTNIE